MSSISITVANLDKKVPFYPTSSLFHAAAADEAINNRLTKVDPNTHFQESNKSHADTLAVTVLTRIISYCGAKGKSLKQHEERIIQQDAKLIVMGPEKKGAPPGMLPLYGAFKSIGTSGNELKVSPNVRHSDLGNIPIIMGVDVLLLMLVVMLGLNSIDMFNCPRSSCVHLGI